MENGYSNQLYEQNRYLTNIKIFLKNNKPKLRMLGFLPGDMFHMIDNDSGFETTVFTRNIREIGRRKFVAVVIIEETNTKGINRLKKVVRWLVVSHRRKKANANVFISSPDFNLSQNGTLGLLLLLNLCTNILC
jgi:hypothetical protein